LDLVFKIAPISDHVAKFRVDQPRDRGDLALNKKRKKERKKAAKHKGSRIALSQRAALTSVDHRNNRNDVFTVPINDQQQSFRPLFNSTVD